MIIRVAASLFVGISLASASGSQAHDYEFTVGAARNAVLRYCRIESRGSNSLPLLHMVGGRGRIHVSNDDQIHVGKLLQKLLVQRFSEKAPQFKSTRPADNDVGDAVFARERNQ